MTTLDGSPRLIHGSRGPRSAGCRWFPILFLCPLALFLAGCPSNQSKSNSKRNEQPLKGLKLRLLVVDDAALADAAGRLRGEWNTQTGSELEVAQAASKDLEAAKSLSADAVIAPSYLLGSLAEEDLLASVPQTFLENRDWISLFDLLKLREATWGRQAETKTKGVPFGSPVLVCYYRPDLLQTLGRRPPQTWREYQELVKLLSSQKPAGDGPWNSTLEPLAPGWAGLVLLSRAAPYAKHRESFSTLFNIDTMEPLLTTPAMQQALEELVAAAKAGTIDPLAMDPAAVRAAFWKGQCGMALTWPTAANDGETQRADAEKPSVAAKSETSPTSETNTAETKPAETKAAAETASAAPAVSVTPIPIGFAELPGTERVYNLSSREWNTRADDEDTHVPLLNLAGRLGMVNNKSANTEAAFQLRPWLADNRTSLQVSAASPFTTVFRRSQADAIGDWVEKAVPQAAADQYLAATSTTLCREQWLAALPLPGRADYLAALDEAVHAAVRGQKSPADALLQANDAWKKITEKLGMERQRSAYRHSLGW